MIASKYNVTNRTIKIMLHCVYKRKTIETNLKEITLRKLMKNMGSKTVFSAVCFTNKLTSFGMGSSLGALLANIMNELEQKNYQTIC